MHLSSLSEVTKVDAEDFDHQTKRTKDQRPQNFAAFSIDSECKDGQIVFMYVNGESYRS